MEVVPVHRIFVKGMVCNCCKEKVKQLLERINVSPTAINLGEIILVDLQQPVLDAVETILNESGFTVIHHKEKRIVEQIKTAVIELIHYANNNNSLIRNSDYLVDKLGFSYPYLSSLFSRHEDMTLEKFIISHKIEKVKELLDYDEFSLSEIAIMLDYSSVQYLSNQFKSIEGITVSEYKRGSGSRKSIDII